MRSYCSDVPSAIPTVDISPYLAHGASPSAVSRVIDSVRSACTTYGFMYLIGHGIPDADMQQILECTRTVSSLPYSEKMKVWIGQSMGRSFRGYEPPGAQVHHLGLLPDTKEAFTVGTEVPADDPEAGSFSTGPNLWPTSLADSDFREPVMEYHANMLKLVRVLLEILSLGLPRDWWCSPDALCQLGSGRPCCPMRLLHYEPRDCLDEREFGVADHTDFGCVSVLLQEPGTEGLQVWYPPRESWVNVPVKKGSFVVNIGETMQMLTSGFYRSATLQDTGDKFHRHSVAFFLNGDLKLNCSALGGSGREVTIGEYIRSRIVETMGRTAASLE
ncbi:hypothetical protein AC579_5244 [Pseudocercospora musae]|uniref:Fe2OG dioxygenase domain-containing protein n=1 Tax=Pseudocercospora musae TaxID=113226 RepID=A0A139IPI5_9PEZI|nr:hypothetical protein AC579_5244 [Pseudocercospora musae]